MIEMKKELLMDVHIDQPDFQNYLLIDREFQGTKLGLASAMSYIRDSFMINNDDFRFFYYQLGINCVNHMELIAKMLHLLHGSDDRYYDEDNDDTPTHELIEPLKEKKPIQPMAHEHVNNDITAATMFHLEDEERQIKLYQEMDAKIQDQGAHEVFAFIIKEKQEHVRILKGILHTLKEPNEVKDFGISPDSHNAFSPNSGNYFDKPNPEFINPSQLKTLHDDHS